MTASLYLLQAVPHDIRLDAALAPDLAVAPRIEDHRHPLPGLELPVRRLGLCRAADVVHGLGSDDVCEHGFFCFLRGAAIVLASGGDDAVVRTSD